MNVLVAMSGGVDSSVAAKILTDAGCSCIGCTMKLYGNGELGLSNMHTCCSIDDTEDARSVAYQLKMRYYVFNFCRRLHARTYAEPVHRLQPVYEV